MSISDFDVEDRDAVQALDYNLRTLKFEGRAVVTGSDVTINSGTLGSGQNTIQCATGTILYDDNTVSVSQQSTGISTAPSGQERRDLVWIDSAGTLQVTEGTPEEVEPPGSEREDAYRPAPPAAQTISGVILAVVSVPGDQSSIGDENIQNRRVSADLQLNEIIAQAISLLTNAATLRVGGDGEGGPHTIAFGNDSGSLDSYQPRFHYRTGPDAFSLENEANGETIVEVPLPSGSNIQIRRDIALNNSALRSIGGLYNGGSAIDVFESLDLNANNLNRVNAIDANGTGNAVNLNDDVDMQANATKYGSFEVKENAGALEFNYTG